MGHWLEHMSDKESSEVEIVQEKKEAITKDTEVEPDKDTPMVDVTNIVIHVNVDDEEVEITDEVHATTSSDQLADNLHDVMMETLPSLVKEKSNESKLRRKFQCKFEIKMSCVQSSSVPEQQHQLYLAMKADPLLQKQDIAIWLALQMKFEKTQVLQSACRFFAIRTRDQDNPHDDAHPEGDNSAKKAETIKYEAYVSGESSSGQVNVEEQSFYFKFPTKQVTLDIMEEISGQLMKLIEEMRIDSKTEMYSGHEHSYPH
ncbi:hypothetical protein Tco_0356903 [Tanacetum coccineum]